MSGIISLKEFIKTGRFGPVSIGSQKEDLLKYFGNNFQHGNFGDTEIIRYNCYEFFYWTENHKIYAIQNDHLLFDCSNHQYMISFKHNNWILDKWFLRRKKNIKFIEITQLLNSENIEFKIERESIANDMNIIRCMESGITFDFCNESTEENNQDNFFLNGIRLFKYD